MATQEADYLPEVCVCAEMMGGTEERARSTQHPHAWLERRRGKRQQYVTFIY